jgi:hypothetical protein
MAKFSKPISIQVKVRVRILPERATIFMPGGRSA